MADWALPSWLSTWFLASAVFVLVIVGGAILEGPAARTFSRFFGDHNPTASALRARLKGAIRCAIVVLAAAIAVQIIPTNSITHDVLNRVLVAGVIIVIGWIAIGFANGLAEGYIGRLRSDMVDNPHARTALTQVRILTRAVDILICVLTLAFALISFPSVRSFGLSLFASAGVAGLIVGLAARPFLESLFAGIQIAMTLPFRLEDVLVVQGQWGWVEEINSTYVVMRLWDLRRYILPLSYLMQNPFENWTRTSPAIMGSVYLYLDYTAPIDEIREKATEIVKSSKRWDGEEISVQISDAKVDAIEVRIVVSARDSSMLWDLRCEVREKILAYIKSQHPDCLPRQRSVLTPSGQNDMPTSLHQAQDASPQMKVVSSG